MSNSFDKISITDIQQATYNPRKISNLKLGFELSVEWIK